MTLGGLNASAPHPAIASIRDSGRMTSKPEVIHPVGRLLPINAPAVTDQSLVRSRLVGTDLAHFPEARFWPTSGLSTNR
jgi:hypothetical protein